MKLTDAQTAAVTEWVEAGKTLSEIQKELANQFHVVMTYMDVRFLVDDLNLSLKDNTPKAPEPKADAPAPEAVPEGAPQADGVLPDAPNPAGVAGGVSVAVDRIMRPGALVSGEATFSDGEKATWQLDQTGRLGLSFKTEGYRPSPEDVQQFQMKLRAELEKSGF